MDGDDEGDDRTQRCEFLNQDVRESRAKSCNTPVTSTADKSVGNIPDLGC